MTEKLRVIGTARLAHPNELVFHFSRQPTDDEMRACQEKLNALSVAGDLRPDARMCPCGWTYPWGGYCANPVHLA